MRYLIPYLLLMNVLGLLLMYADKRRAKRKSWRIPERTLLLVAALGGGLGSLMGMYLFRHKTRHRKFTILVPLFLALQTAGFLYLLLR